VKTLIEKMQGTILTGRKTTKDYLLSTVEQEHFHLEHSIYTPVCFKVTSFSSQPSLATEIHRCEIIALAFNNQ